MKFKSQKSKFKGEGQNSAVNTAMLAALLTIFLHGLVFSIPAYLIYTNSKGIIQNSKVEQKNDTIFIDISMLPVVRESGEKSAIKDTEGKKQEAAGQEPGLNGQAEKQGEENVEKEMLTYRDIIKQKIQQARKYPVEARQRGVEGAVEMVFTLMRQGVLKNVEVIGASGSEVLDEEAVATIKRASPFPEIPADYKDVEMTMNVKIVFNIE
jgi:TonB family protein